ncbi:glycosyltransferase [Pseudovibrio denitrificans]|uniref:glycosyltransferase n=1 Tax=Pseudovibrio denitrificans TaxID=258256 RepID=UPI0039BED342
MSIPRIFIGYDSREIVAYHALCQSIIEHASIPVQFCPIAKSSLGGIFHRESHPLQSTEFSFSRFLTPYLSGYEGWSLFMDCDMIFRKDIAELWSLRDDRYAVMCCKHNYEPEETTKFLGNTQTKYAKKNWSSVILFNNARCKSLTPEYVNTRSGLELHQFKWLTNDDEIGSLPLEWNHLVGVYDYDPNAAIVHYTIGGPYFEDFKDCDYSQDWEHYKTRMLSAQQVIKSEPVPA